MRRRSNCVSVWCCSRKLMYQRLASWLLVRCSTFQRNLFTGDLRRHWCFLSNHRACCSQPCHKFQKTNERGTRPKCKKHENTTASKKQETHHLRFQMLAELSIGYNEKKKKHQRSNAIVQRGPLLRLVVPKRYPSTLGEVYVFSYHIGHTCPIEECSGSRNGLFFFLGGARKRERRGARLCGT